jgi:putative ABC transport system permease protein
VLTVTLKGVLAHKLRTLLTALSIALSVAFVAGTLVLTDSLTSSFSKAFENQYAGVDVAVRSEAAFSDSEAADQRRPLPASVLETVRAVPGVAHAEGFVTGTATMIGPDGTTLGAGARSNAGMSAPVRADVGDVRYASGRAPAAADEVAIDAAAAESGAVTTGDRIRVLFQGPPREFTVVGIARFGDADRLGATTTALFDLATAQDVLGRTGQYDAVRVVADDGLSAAALQERLEQAVPAGSRRRPPTP